MNAVAHELPVRRCRECRAAFRARVADQKFCPGNVCRRKWHRRHEVRGGQVMPMLMTLRAERHLPKEKRTVSLSDITHKVDGFLADDRAAGRGVRPRRRRQP